jgi:hypothetical protein
MFNYGLDQFIEIYLWERQRETRLLRRADHARPAPRERWRARRAAFERVLTNAGRLFARLSHAPHGRA